METLSGMLLWLFPIDNADDLVIDSYRSCWPSCPLEPVIVAVVCRLARRLFERAECQRHIGAPLPPLYNALHAGWDDESALRLACLVILLAIFLPFFYLSLLSGDGARECGLFTTESGSEMILDECRKRNQASQTDLVNATNMEFASTLNRSWNASSESPIVLSPSTLAAVTREAKSTPTTASDISGTALLLCSTCQSPSSSTPSTTGMQMSIPVDMLTVGGGDDDVRLQRDSNQFTGSALNDYKGGL